MNGKKADLCGSPPRSWGIPLGLGALLPRDRFTPTLVGNTYAPFSGPSGNSVHPHARGEYSMGIGEIIQGNGSPPRSWGIRHIPGNRFYARRFTPTLVGNTNGCQTRHIVPTVHPHARGEYLCTLHLCIKCIGSPPRSWGILNLRLYRIWSLRFTPTLVGNTKSCYFFPLSSTVHPHARGEYRQSIFPQDFGPGSPPRSWGILILHF